MPYNINYFSDIWGGLWLWMVRKSYGLEEGNRYVRGIK